MCIELRIELCKEKIVLKRADYSNKKGISEDAEFSRGRNFLLESINCELGTF